MSIEESYKLLSRADAAGLKAAGVTKVNADGKTWRLDKDAMADKIAAYLIDKATVSTEVEFAERGISLQGILQFVCGLPATASLEATEFVGGFVKQRLVGTAVGDVQQRLDSTVKKWLVHGAFQRITTDTVELTTATVKKTLYAVSADPDIIHVYAALPSHKRVLSAEFGNLRDTMEQITRVPEMAPKLVAIHQQRQALVGVAHDKVIDRVTSAMSEIERKAFFSDVERELTALEPSTAKVREAIESA